MGNIKQINVKNQTDYSSNDMINIKDFDSNFLKNRQKVVQKYWYLQHWIHHN